MAYWECFFCRNLKGCPTLYGGCSGERWEQLTNDQMSYRGILRDALGVLASSKLVNRLGASEETMIDPNPDFYSMLYEGITKQERDEQLRYELKKDGQPWLDEDGRKRPRSDFLIRRYALEHPDERFPRLDSGNSIGWKLEEIIGYILKHETEIGLIGKKSKKKKEGDMPTAKTANIKRVGGGKNVKTGVKTGGAGKVAKPPSRSDKVVVGKKGGAKKDNGKMADADAAAVISGDLEAQITAMREQLDGIESKMQSMIGDAVTAVIEKMNESMVKAQDMYQKIIDSQGLMHDLHVDTHGTFHYEDMETDEEGNIVQEVDEDGEGMVDEDGEPIAAMTSVPLDKVLEHDNGILKYFEEPSGE